MADSAGRLKFFNLKKRAHPARQRGVRLKAARFCPLARPFPKNRRIIAASSKKTQKQRLDCERNNEV
jgi:hypothetical protein